jgi:3-dehydroquinate synthase
MLMAADLSARHGWLSTGAVQRTGALLRAAGLPTSPPAEMTADRFMELMAVDKKVMDGGLRLVLLKDIGNALVTSDFRQDLLAATLAGSA